MPIPNWRYGVVDLANDVSTISPVSVAVKGYYVNEALSAHACNINDGADTAFIIPASTVAGTLVEFTSVDGIIFENSLIIDPDNSATGNITVIYRERTR